MIPSKNQPTHPPTHPPTRPPTKPPSTPTHPPVEPPPSKRYPPITWPALDFDFAKDNDPAYKGNCFDREFTYGVDAQVTSDHTCINRDKAYCNIAYTEHGELLLYKFHNTESGKYTIRLRVAALNSGKEVRVVLTPSNSAPFGETFVVNGVGWQDFFDIHWDNVHLEEDSYELEVIFLTGNTNLCSVSVYESDVPPPHPNPTRSPTRHPTRSPTRKPTHQPTPAPTPEGCKVCPPDEDICNPDETVVVPPGNIVACRDLEETAEMRDFTAAQCDRFKEDQNIDHVCGCARTCTVPTRPPTRSPSELYFGQVPSSFCINSFPNLASLTTCFISFPTSTYRILLARSPTPAPTQPPVFPEECRVCPSGEDICDPGATVIVPPGDVVACDNLEDTAANRGFSAQQCTRFKNDQDVENVCACAASCSVPTRPPSE